MWASGTTKTAFLALTLLAFCQCAFGGVIFRQGGSQLRFDTPQLWYEGMWQDVDWVNATLRYYPTNDITNRIILVLNPSYPYEPLLRKLSPLQPAAILMVQEQTGIAGDGMYAVDGKERRSITVPVAEAYVTKVLNISVIPDGSYIEMRMDANLYKPVMDSAYFPVMNSLVSLWEWCLILLALYHIYLFKKLQRNFSWLSIAVVCLTLEITGLAIRFGTTIVDPFLSARIYPVATAYVLPSVHLPFLLSSGILLTFYWAEMLTSTSLQVTPFISKYRRTAIVAVVLLFAMEIVMDVLRISFRHSRVNPVIFSAIYYFIVSITLAVCYITCAIAIARRVKSIGGKKYSAIRRMNLRFALSSIGYVLMVLLEIGVFLTAHRPWSSQIFFYLLYICYNFTSMMIILGLQPTPPRSAPHTKSSHKPSSSSERSKSSAKSVLTADSSSESSSTDDASLAEDAPSGDELA